MTTTMTATASPTPPPALVDAAKAEAFAGFLVETVNRAGLVLMISVGHRTGLFDAMHGEAPATCEEIAARAGLNERYVREWLAALTVGGVVEHDPGSGRYRLPLEHAGFLTRAAGADNLAAISQYIPVLAGVEDDIVECFRRGGGVPYERYARFHEVMAEDSAMTVLAALESHILPLVPGLVDRLERGIRVLDAGCGRGLAMLQLAERFPRSRFVGYDLSQEAVDFARERARRTGLGNVEFSRRDLSDFDVTAEPGAFDLVTSFDAIHDQARPAAVLAGIARSLAAEGVYLAQDVKASSHLHHNVDHPLGTILYTISCFHCMSVSLAQGGDGLGAMWGRETAEAMFRDAGFASVEVHELEHDIQNLYYVCRR